MKDAFYSVLGCLGKTLNFEQMATAGNRLGDILWHSLPSRRDLATEALIRHIGMTPEAAKEAAHRSFRHNARSFLDIFHTDRVDERFMAERLTVSDSDAFSRLATETRPIVGATGHFGAWELLGALMGTYLPRKPKAVVVRRTKNLALHRQTTRMRSRPGLAVIDHRNAAPKVLRLLRSNGAVAFLVDHNCSRSEAVFLPFLGRRAAVNMGPALLAIRGQALVWPIFLKRLEGGKYLLDIERNPLDTTKLEGSVSDRVHAVAEYYTEAVEKRVKETPDQWFWMHKRWKTQPAEE